MTPFWVKIASIIVVTCMFYFVLWRFFSFFHNYSKVIPLVISIVLACVCIWAFFYQWENKIIDITSIFAWRLFVLSFLLFLILIIEYVVSIRYKVNPWIIVWFIIVFFWVWAYFSLHTKITYLNIETNKIHKDTKILLVSDIHAENVMQSFHINKIRKTIEAERPDFTIIAWDLINKANRSYAEYYKDIEPDYNPKYKPLIFAVIWNHDVMWNIEAIKKVVDVSNVVFLNNKTITYVDWATIGDWCDADNSFETCTWAINIIWLVDKSLWWNNSLDQNLKNANANKLNDNNFNILVTHQPISLEKLKDYPVDLEVAWHTHRGQFYWMRKVVELVNDYAYWEYKLWDRTAFVTQWIWTWWLPFRLWTQSEIVIINLKKK